MEKQINDLMDLLHMLNPQIRWYGEFGIKIRPDEPNYWFCGLAFGRGNYRFQQYNLPTIEAAQQAFILRIKTEIKTNYDKPTDERALSLYKRII